jgi:hypothetical protein
MGARNKDENWPLPHALFYVLRGGVEKLFMHSTLWYIKSSKFLLAPEERKPLLPQNFIFFHSRSRKIKNPDSNIWDILPCEVSIFHARGGAK